MSASEDDRTRTLTWGRDGRRVRPEKPPSIAEQPTSAGASSAPGHESEPAAPSLPERIGDYRILSKLGEGGMGVVYEAVQNNPRREVALKIVRGGRHVDPLHVRMFQREVDTLGRLRHPAIAAIYESGVTDDGQHFFAMELVRGVTLTSWMKERADDVGSVAELRLRLALFRKICHAVAYAHQRGVIHRDIKPSNILVAEPTADSGSSSSTGSMSAPGLPDVKILDFGLARITESEQPGATLLTEAGKVQGTLPYMSPEQVRGDSAEIDLRTDVYSLGVLLYEMLTGRLPYDLEGAGLPEAARAICEEAPLPLTRTWTGRRKLDRDISTIVLKALEKEPDRRYQSVSGLGEDIERYLSDQPISARPPSAAYQLKKLVARHKLAFGAATAMLALVVASSVGMTGLYVQQQAATERTQEALQQKEEAFLEAEREKQLAEAATRRAEAERQRADASKAEIERNSRELAAIIPTLEQELAGYRMQVRDLETRLRLSEARAVETPRSDPPAPEPVAREAGTASEPAVVGRWGRFGLQPAPDEEPPTEPTPVAGVSVTSDLNLLAGRNALLAGDYVEAEIRLLRCYDELEEGPRKNEVRRLLVRLYDNMGQRDTARRYREQLENVSAGD